jgi:phosphoglucomutase
VVITRPTTRRKTVANPPHGGPAEEITKWVEDRANAILEAGLPA